MLFAWPKKPLEIRVHLEKTTELDTYDRALEFFLKMDETELGTNLPCCKDQTFVIWGSRD
jgi:hypothetical protein